MLVSSYVEREFQRSDYKKIKIPSKAERDAAVELSLIQDDETARLKLFTGYWQPVPTSVRVHAVAYRGFEIACRGSVYVVARSSFFSLKHAMRCVDFLIDKI